MRTHNSIKNGVPVLLLVCLCLIVGAVPPAAATDSLCAEVKIEIRQELTLERQAFDAHMKINNGLTHIALEDVSVEVTFADQEGNQIEASTDPNSTTAQFFIRKDSEGFAAPAENSDGTWNITDVNPSSSSDLHWLIIPTTGAADGRQDGKVYYVGAKLTYTLGGEEYVTEVTPDYIYVKPLPELALDYFLTRQVYGDDAFTTEVEPPVPFTLGVRVKNFGNNTAYDLQIDSAQPQIIENEQGLLIGFSITDCRVNGVLAPGSLLADFGNIEPDTAGVGRWIMECTLSGEFTEFAATITHADELGGELTSLIKQEDVNTHFLVKDVLVDIPGRDGIHDFLARDGDIFRVYESGCVDTETADPSAQSTLQFSGASGSQQSYTLTTPSSAGFIYVKLPDPEAGEMVVAEAVRSDGKQIQPANVWLSKERKENPADGWNYFINLFDVDSTGSYTIAFGDAAAVSQAPVLSFISDKFLAEGEPLGFLVEASDPNGTVPALSVSALPAGAVFTDQEDGSGIFDWTPAVGQAGIYSLVFTASDGEREDKQLVTITVCPVDDTDCDGLRDDWEITHFGDLSRDGTGDYDGDGISDLDEFLNGSDPNGVDLAGPSAPVIAAPANAGETTTLSPQLVIENSLDPDDDFLTYTFELYTEPEYSNRVAYAAEVAETTDTTAWTVTETLSDNTTYYWRVRAFDGAAYSLWRYGRFLVNTANDAPGNCRVSSPPDGTAVDALSPALEITNSTDIDGDVVTYTFEIYEDSGLTTLVASATDIPGESDGTTGWTVDTVLTDNTDYYWQVIATDEHGAQTETVAGSFTTDTANQAPTAGAVSSPAADAEIATTAPDLVVSNATDADGDPLTYAFELDTVRTFDSADKVSLSGLAEGVDTTVWSVLDLADNTAYYWRARASDGAAAGPWTTGRFFVNTANDTPPVPTRKNPGKQVWVDVLAPELAVNPVREPDNDDLTYRFAIYTDKALTDLVDEFQSSQPAVTVSPELTDNTRYYWRAQAEDIHGAVGEWCEAVSFFVKYYNRPSPQPQITLIEPAVDILTNSAVTIAWEDADTDSNAAIALYYDTDNTGADGTLIADNLWEDPDGSDDTYVWEVTDPALEGTWNVYAVITDGETSATAYAPGAVTIDTTPPVVTAAPAGGTYIQEQVITLSADEAADFYYTLDGTDPDTFATLYLSPFTISSSLVLKYLGIDAAGNQSAVGSEEYVISSDNLPVTVTTDAGAPVSGVNVYAFTESGTYTGLQAATDGEGAAFFTRDDFAGGNYKFRVDYLGSQFWTETVALPGTAAVEKVIAVQTVEVTVTTAAGVTEGVPVYLFTESGTYLNRSAATDVAGQVSFTLPVGETYLFRADIMSSQYWSDTVTVAAGGATPASVAAGGGRLSVYVEDESLLPLEGLNTYLFQSTGTYLNQYAVTDVSGAVFFDVSEGTYKVRADYLGYQFWSVETAVTTDTDLALTIPHQDVVISVNSLFQGVSDPMENIDTYLFTASGTYLNRSQTTDANGRVYLTLPEQPYQVRADYLNRQYWSDVFTWADQIVEIPLADAEITVTDGVPLADIPVYVFTDTGTYLNITGTTDANGQVTFRLPAGDYKFRADYQNSRYWSELTPLAADAVKAVNLSVGGGEFTLTVMQNATDPLVGVTCYVFDDTGTYLNLSDVTNSDGTVAFELASGDYKIRVDHLGYQFWTEVFTVPDTLDEVLTIAHQETAVNLYTVYQGVPEPLSGVKVYLFTESGTYMNQNQAADAGGQVLFPLPEQPYQVRADYLDRQYWSDVFTWGDQIMEISMADAEITVSGGGLPQAGVPVYVFTAADTYLNLSGTTDTNGQVTFRLPAGDYKFRTDYQGSQYWSETTALTADQVNPINVSVGGGTFTLTVLKNATDALAGAGCYLFSDTGSYLSLSNVTSSEGQVAFDLASGDYKIRVDYLGYQFWTEVFTVPDTLSAVFTIPHQDVVVHVHRSGTDQAGAVVYLFTGGGSYLNRSQTTDANGLAEFVLPEESYKFRADEGSDRVYSSAIEVQSGGSNSLEIDLD